MDTGEREIRLYVTRTGKVPYARWLDSLKDVRGRAVVRVRMNRIRLGNFGDCRSVGEGVMELRIDHGPGYRVYFEQAQSYWADFRRREHGDE